MSGRWKTCFHDVSILSGNEKSNTGQSDSSNRMIGVFARRCRFFVAIHEGPADRNRTHSIGESFFCSLRKTFGHLRTRQKKQRQLQQLVQNSISTIKCSSRLGSRPWIRFRFYVENPTAPPLPVSNPVNI